MKDVGTSRYSVDNFWLLNHPRHKPLKWLRMAENLSPIDPNITKKLDMQPCGGSICEHWICLPPD